MMKRLSKLRLHWRVWLAVLMVFGTGCAVSHTRKLPPGQVRPVLDATKEQLLARYNEQARAVKSLNAAVEFIPTAGGSYSGVIIEYHQVNGFILAERSETAKSEKALVRVIGQAPVVSKNVFDMVSDGQTFKIYIPSKNKFLVGSTELERPAKKPIENLRPQHLVDALFWPEFKPYDPVLVEEADLPPDHFYVLTSLRQVRQAWEIEREIWFDRADLGISRIEIFGPGGRLDADIRYAEWASADGPAFPRRIWLRRPHDDYQLEISVKRITLNQPIPADRFVLEQPAGTELVRVGEDQTGKRP